MDTQKGLTWLFVLILGLLLFLYPQSALAGSPKLQLGEPQYDESLIKMDVQFQDLFDQDSRTSLQSGVPATLVFQWVLRKEVYGWRDTEVGSGEIRNRVIFDVLEEEFFLFNHQGRPLGACNAVAEIESSLCTQEEFVLQGFDPLDKEESYYVEMEISLIVLSDEQVRGFEDWLSGGSADGSEEDPVVLEISLEEGDVSFGFSDMALGFVKRMAGISERKVKAESPKVQWVEKQAPGNSERQR